MSHKFTARDIEAVTQGAVTPNRIGLWVHRRMLRTRLKEPKAGKPRLFSFANVLEVALISEFSTTGVPLERAATYAHNVLGKISAGDYDASPLVALAWAPGGQMVAITDPRLRLVDIAAKVGGETVSVLLFHSFLKKVKEGLAAQHPEHNTSRPLAAEARA